MCDSEWSQGLLVVTRRRHIPRQYDITRMPRSGSADINLLPFQMAEVVDNDLVGRALVSLDINLLSPSLPHLDLHSN